MCNFYICTIVNRNKKAFWHSMIMRIDLGKIFLAIFIIGVIARIFTLAVLPESALVDSLYHISVAEKIAAEQAVPLVDRVIISPLYYVFSASLHIISNFPFEMPFEISRRLTAMNSFLVGFTNPGSVLEISPMTM